MNAKQLIAAAVVFSAASTAFAQSAEASAQTYGFLGMYSPAASQNVTSDKTRAEIVTEMKEAPSVTYSFAGITQPVGTSDHVIQQGKTRAEVVAELKKAAQDGSLQVASFAGYHSPVNGKAESLAPQAVASK